MAGTEYKPTQVSHPGESILESLEAIGMTQEEFARRLGMAEKTVSQIINGIAPITEETALKLERVLGGNAEFWLSRESKYREWVAREEQRPMLIRTAGWVKQELPIAQMKRRGIVPSKCNDETLALAVLTFFGVASELQLQEVAYSFGDVDYRKSQAYRGHSGALAVWLRECIVASRSDLPPFSKAALKAILPEVKTLTHESNAVLVVEELKALCGKAGVAFVFNREVQGAAVNGAAGWFGQNPMLALSGRHARLDIFWFSFFHEAAHLILHGKKDAFVESEELLHSMEEKEQEADRFAADMLIAKGRYTDFVAALKSGNFSYTGLERSIREFANQECIHPSIVLGRVQRDGVIAHNSLLNKILHTRYDFSDVKASRKVH